MAKGLAALTVAEDEPGEGSTLDVFDPSNPFKPPKDIIANSDESTDSGDRRHRARTDTGATDTGSDGADTGGGHRRRDRRPRPPTARPRPSSTAT